MKIKHQKKTHKCFLAGFLLASFLCLVPFEVLELLFFGACSVAASLVVAIFVFWLAE